MPEYEVIVEGVFTELFESENEETARAEMLRDLPLEFQIEGVEVIEVL